MALGGKWPKMLNEMHAYVKKMLTIFKQSTMMEQEFCLTLMMSQMMLKQNKKDDYKQ